MKKEELIELLSKMPDGAIVGVYIENIDSVVEIVDVEFYNGEINIRVDY